jgi:hypothetical protein
VSRRDKRKLQDVKPAALPLEDRARADSDTREANGESPAWRFIGAYLTLILVGFMVFRHPATMVGGNEMSPDRAMFTSVNAVTLTGFQQTLAIDEYRWPGKIAAFLLTIGGTIVTLIAAGKAVARIAKTGCHDRGIIIGAAVLEGLAILVGAILLPGRGEPFRVDLSGGQRDRTQRPRDRRSSFRDGLADAHRAAAARDARRPRTARAAVHCRGHSPTRWPSPVCALHAHRMGGELRRRG